MILKLKGKNQITTKKQGNHLSRKDATGETHTYIHTVKVSLAQKTLFKIPSGENKWGNVLIIND